MRGWSAVVLGLGLLACGAKVDELADDGETDTSGDGDGDGDGESCPSIEICSPEASDPFDVIDLKLEGDCLWVTVVYGGGCEPHDFTACWTGAWKDSLPPQVWLQLDHDAHGDGCEGEIQRTLFFDLSLLREAGEGSGPVDVHVQGYPIPVVYDF